MLTNAIVTFYCSCVICCGPGAKGITASGKAIRPGMLAAPRNIKFGTQVVINNRTYTVEDRTARRFNGRFDIYVPSHQQALKLGKKVCLVNIH